MTIAKELERREARRRAHEASRAEAWLLSSMPDDPELRAYVHAYGMLLVAHRAVVHHTRETIRLGDELLTLRDRHAAANLERLHWLEVTAEAVRAFDEARGAWRREAFRREHAGELDHAAHVWAWYRERWEKVGAGGGR